MRIENSDVRDHSIARAGFILLNTKAILWDSFFRNLMDDWSILPDEKQTESNILVFKSGGMTVSCALAEIPVPNNEAVENAKNNFLWKKAVEVASQHVAHIVLAVTGKASEIEISLLFTKVAASFLKLENATSIYQAPTVISKETYILCAEDIRQDTLPILDWVYIGIYPDGSKRFSGYTYGLAFFGKDEFEVIKSHRDPSSIYEIFFSVAAYVLETNATILHGQTIGFTAKQKLKIQRRRSRKRQLEDSILTTERERERPAWGRP